MDLVAGIVIGALGVVGLSASAKVINDYGERIVADMNRYVDYPQTYQTNYTNGRQQAYADQKLMNLSDTIYKVRDMCIEDERIQVAPERAELYSLLEQAASLVDTIRVRS